MAIEGAALSKLSLDIIPEASFYIPATGPATRPRRTLKHDDTFVVLDSHGDIGARPAVPTGCSIATRVSSRISNCLLDGIQPLLLGSNVRDDGTSLTVDLTNPDVYLDNHLSLPKDTVHVVRTIVLWCDTVYQRLRRSRNHGDHPIDLRLTMLFDSDFADLFEVRGLRRERRGAGSRQALRPTAAILSYEGFDKQLRRTVLHFDPPPSEITATAASYRLAGAEAGDPDLLHHRLRQPQPREPVPLLRGLRAVHRDRRVIAQNAATVETSNERSTRCVPVVVRPAHADDAHAARLLSVRRHPLVLDDVRP